MRESVLKKEHQLQKMHQADIACEYFHFSPKDSSSSELSNATFHIKFWEQQQQ